jgi:hypothetical protein
MPFALKERPMITFKSLVKVDRKLVSLDDLVEPFRNEENIDGAIELKVSGRPLLTRDHVDLVVVLWASWIEGLEEVSAGRSFSTSYPGLFLEIMLQPRGAVVVIEVNDLALPVVESVPLAELRHAMVAGGWLFFERLRPLITLGRARFDGYLARLAVLRKLDV